MKKQYVVDYEWDPEARSWSALVQDLPGCHSYGRGLREAMVNIREALALWLDLEPETQLADRGIRVVDRPHVPGLSDDIVRIPADRDVVDRMASDLADRTSRAAKELVAQGIPMRDAAVMLGISHQRVGQLAGSRER